MLGDLSSSSAEDSVDEPRNDIQIVAGGVARESWLDWFLNGCASWQPAQSTAAAANSDEALTEKLDEDARIQRFRPEIAAALRSLNDLPERITMSTKKQIVAQSGKSKLTATPDLIVVGDLDEEPAKPSQSSPQRSVLEFRALEILPGRPDPSHHLKSPQVPGKDNQRPASSRWFHISLLNSGVPASVIDAVVNDALTVLYPLLCDRDRLIWCLDWGITALRHCECQYTSLRQPLEISLRSEGLNADSSAKSRDSNVKNIIQQTHRLKSFVVLKSIDFRSVEEIVGEWEQILESPTTAPQMVLLSKSPVACAIFMQPNKSCSVFDIGCALSTKSDGKAPKYKIDNVSYTSSWTDNWLLRDPSVAAFSLPTGVLSYVMELMELPGGGPRIAFSLLTSRGVSRLERASLATPDDNADLPLPPAQADGGVTDQRDILRTLRADFSQIDRYGL